jgi:hypothetical protein
VKDSVVLKAQSLLEFYFYFSTFPTKIKEKNEIFHNADENLILLKFLSNAERKAYRLGVPKLIFNRYICLLTSFYIICYCVTYQCQMSEIDVKEAKKRDIASLVKGIR